VYVVRTTAGLVMIDALFANQVETQLLPGFSALGLDPALVKIVVSRTATPITSAAYTFRRSSARKSMSPPLTDGHGEPPLPRWTRTAGPPRVIPKHDADIVDGQKITLGDLTITPIAGPGTRPDRWRSSSGQGSGASHTAALFGGAWLTPNI
jgi:metallo-beta-lactamase class B